MRKLKAISLWQPWATAVALGAKRIETRHWYTPQRGLIAIHAAKRVHKGEMIALGASWGWCGALERRFMDSPMWATLPLGAIVATARLVDCRPTGDFTQAELDAPRIPNRTAGGSYAWTERMMGAFSLGRFGWVLEDVTRLAEPIPWKGSQGWFDVEIP